MKSRLKLDADEEEPAGGQRSNTRVRLKTLHRMAAVLRSFTLEHSAWTLQELEQHLGWDKATTHRFLHGLVDVQMLELGEDGAYRIGLLPQELAAIQTSTNSGWGHIRERVAEIAERTGLTTQLGVLDEPDVVVVFSKEGNRALNAAAMLGQRLPLHATAMGKVILADVGDERRDALLPDVLERYTPKTITDRAQLLSEIAGGAEHRLARADSEMSEGLYAVAVQVPAHVIGHPGAVACAGPPIWTDSAAWEAAERELVALEVELRSFQRAVVPAERAAQAVAVPQGV